MWENAGIDKLYFANTRSCKAFNDKTLRKYGGAWARGFAEKNQVDEPYVKSSAPEASKNGFCGF